MPEVSHDESTATLIHCTADEVALLKWFRESTFAGQMCGFQLLRRLQSGVAPAAAVEHYERAMAAQVSPETWWRQVSA